MVETWIDIRTGDLLIGATAAEPRIQEGGPDIVPLKDLLRNTDFPYASGDYDKAAIVDWTREDYITYGKWVLNVMSSQEDPKPVAITQPILQRMYVLGLGPESQRFRQIRFKSFKDFREAIESPASNAWGMYSDWKHEDFVNHALAVAERKKQKPTKADYDALASRNEGPAMSTIWWRVGSLDDLHELIGYPNIRKWEHEDFISWGVKVVEINGLDAFNTTAVEVLSRKCMGPAYNSLRKEFGTWPAFRYEVEKRFKAKINFYEDMAARGELPESLIKLASRELFIAAAKFMVASRCAPTLASEKKESICLQGSANFVASLLKSNSQLTAGYIETAAVGLDVYDDIWPNGYYEKNLQIRESEIQRINDEFRRRKHRQRSQRKAA